MSNTNTHLAQTPAMTLHSLTRAMLGTVAAAHGYHVASALRNAGCYPEVAALGQVHDLAEDTDLDVLDVANLVMSTSGINPDLLEEVFEALDAVTRRDGEVYADFIERVRATSPLAVAIKLADLRDNLERCTPSLAKRYRRALARLEPAEPTPDTLRRLH